MTTRSLSAPRPVRRLAILLAALAALHGCASRSDTYPWPGKQVSPQSLRLLAPLSFNTYLSARSQTERAPTLLRLHVDADGQVRHVVVAQPSGDASQDQSAVMALKAARFAPVIEDGVPVAVTTVVEMLGRRSR